MSQLPHVTWLRAFEAAARHSSFAAAADELNLTPAAISQQIKLLETHVGEPLFRRLARGVALTDTGHAYAQPVRKAFSDMQQATNGLFGAKNKRTLHVRASVSYAALVLAPRLSEFLTLYPDIDVRLTTAVWTERDEDEEIDVEIRYGHGDWAEPDIRHLGHRFAEVVCHPDVVSSLGETLTFQTLAAQAIQIIGTESDWDQMAEHFGLTPPAVIGRTKADSSMIALQILAGGSGAAIVSDSFIGPWLKSKALVSPLPYRLPLRRSFFLIAHDAAHKRSDLRLFCDWLSDMHRTHQI